MKQRFSLLGVPIDTLTREELFERIDSVLDGKTFTHIATVNPEFLVEAHKNKKFKNILQHTLNICDGGGISILSKILYRQRMPRITGVEVAEMICTSAEKKKKSVFLLGGYGGVSKALKKKYPKLNIVGEEGGIRTLRLSEEIKKASPDIILVCYGAPFQEEWIAQNAPKIPNLKLAGGFGGTFDFWTGKVKRAPKWMRNLHIEWLYRLIMEPKKRFKRIMRAVLVFPFLVVKEKILKAF